MYIKENNDTYKNNPVKRPDLTPYTSPTFSAP